MRSLAVGAEARLAQTNERTVVAELIADVNKILYSTAEDVVVDAL